MRDKFSFVARMKGVVDVTMISQWPQCHGNKFDHKKLMETSAKNEKNELKGKQIIDLTLGCFCPTEYDHLPTF